LVYIVFKRWEKKRGGHSVEGEGVIMSERELVGWTDKYICLVGME